MKLKNLLSALLAAIMLFGLMPMGALAAETYDLSDGSIKVIVSGDNGGFLIQTEEGDSLIKSDDNKNLLYHRDAYDTSFTSFRVTEEDGTVRDYLFGGSYGFLGLSSSAVTTTRDTTGIQSVWSVDDLTFTQRIELPGAGANEHGAVLISYSVANASGSPVDVQARLLFDTALGDQDFAYYEVVDQYGAYRSIEREMLIEEADYIPANYFGYDDNMNPEITAYNMYTGEKPYQLAFGHWNNLAATLFDFTPDDTMTFTNQYNADYLTADSAVAMWFDVGQVTDTGSFSTYYGVYSNKAVAASDSIAINLTAPAEMTLSADKTTYLPGEEGLASGVFKVQAQLNNFVSDTAQDFRSVTVAAYAANGLEPLDALGNSLSGTPTYLEPYTVRYDNFVVGQTQTTSFLFRADVGAASEFRKIEFRAFDTSSDSMLTADNMIGSKSFYVLCPGGDGKLPEVIFTAMKPGIIYNQGQRNLFVSGKNFNLLVDETQYNVRAYSTSDDRYYDITSEQVVFSQEQGVDTMTVMLTEEMPVGTYELVFDWIGNPPTGLKRRMTAPALQFTVSDDKQYKNDYYGIVAVVQEGSGGTAWYNIKRYKTEEEFNQDKGNYTEVLLTFRGDFEEDELGGKKMYRATSVKVGDKAENVVVVNDCIDFENGTVTIHYGDSGILVDFDGDLYTSVKRSKIWSGEATFTEIQDGYEYGLVPYNGDGERMEGDYGQQITLLWPCGLSIAQNISGMAFNLTFGAMGIVYDINSTKFSQVDKNTPVKGRVVSFSASLDLSFLIPGAGKSSKDRNWESIAVAFGSEMTSTELRNKWTGVDMINRSYNGLHYKDNRTKDGQGSVMVQDILYGCGEGLMGVNFDVDLVLPGYFDAMPSLIGHLSVNTIAGYEVGVDGACQFGTLEVEASITIRDKDGVPIPDKLYFAIMGFEPGINVDGFGVLWITGGGGGIDKLYDTIFGGSSVPPLKIMLTVSFDILKTLAARVDLSLSLRGLSLTARDVKVKYLEVPVLNRAQLAFEWYPEFYFMASVDADILGVIQGQGYIVILKNDDYDAFVEFFIRAGIQIPDKIPILGGIRIGGVDLGANNQKIWGVVRALGAELGVTYYWGGDVDFGTGSAVSKPSFPNLLGHEDVPVYYDEETGRTLYMHVGNNLSYASAATIIGENTNPVLLGADRTIASRLEKTYHELTLGAYNNTDAALVISYQAEDKDKAEEYADGITIGGQPLTFYDADLANENTANANLVYHEDTQTAEVNVVFSEEADFDGNTKVLTTPVASNLALYDINPIPKLTSLDGTVSGNNITVNWSGTMIDQLDSVMFALTDDPNGNPNANIYPIGYAQYGYVIDDETATFTLPADLPTGTYYLQAVYSKEDIINEKIVATSPILHTNSHQPSAPSSVTAVNGGDYMLDLTVEKADESDFDGYIVNVYEEDEQGAYVLSDISNLVFEKDADGNLPALSAGGYFEVPTVDDEGNPGSEMKGLEPGKAYHIGVTAFKSLTDTEGNITGQVLSGEVRTAAPVTLNEPTPPAVEITNVTTDYITVSRTQDGVADPLPVDTFSVSSMTFQVDSDVPVTGTWTLNDTETGTLAGDPIAFTDLDDGDYKLTLTGEDAEGDGFIVTKIFAVDTLPPVLLLSSPVNGGFFSADGSITVSGTTEANALLTIYVNGDLHAQGQTITELGGTIDSAGVFSLTVPGVPSKSAQTLVISAEDALGHTTEVTTATVYNKGLAQIESLTIYADGRSYSNNNIPTGGSGISAVLSLGVNTPSGTFLLADDDLVDWSVQTALGSAAVDENILTAGADSMGTITAQFYVAEVDDAAAQEGYVGAMHASATFGQENNEVMSDLFNVSVASDIGGSVLGGGYYAPGDTVTLSVAANSGYTFGGWSVLSGAVTLSSTGDETITFTMPAEDVTLEAAFTYVSSRREGSGTSGGFIMIDSAAPMNGEAGQLYSFNLPQETEGTTSAPFYYEDGKRVYVKMSAEIDGKLYFIAPQNATYYLAENAVRFDDIAGHWAETNILYTAAREIFTGVSDTAFAPNDNMTRAMFVTVLGRLAGVSADMNRASGFADVPAGQWYTPYVAWAAEHGIVEGYGDGSFGPNDLVTREQMCAIIARYLKAQGYELAVKTEPVTFADNDQVSEWAKEFVTYCQTRELIVGKDNNCFAPQDNTTRAEAATLLKRLIEQVLQAGF